MCHKLIWKGLKLILTVLHVLHLLFGLGVVIFGLYLSITYVFSTFSELVIGIGGWACLTALMGLLLTLKTSRKVDDSFCFLKLYSIFLTILLMANLIILIICYINFALLLSSIPNDVK